MITHEDFVNELNYMMHNGEGDLDTNDPDEMLYYKESVAAMMQDNCGSTVGFEVVNSKGEIRLIQDGGDQ